MATTAELNHMELINEFKNFSLDPANFSHEACLKLSWVLNSKYSAEIAAQKYDTIITNYTEKVLTHVVSHKALNLAYSEIVRHFMDKSSGHDFDKLLREFPRLKYNFKSLVKTHYGYDILKEKPKESRPNRPILFTF